MRNATRYPSLFERLVANTREEGDCWIWTGAVRKHYPSFTRRVPGRPHPVATQAHRAMRIETATENLSDRRGYAACDGRMIPVLFPTADRLLDEAAELAWSTPGVSGQDCPF